MTLSPNFFAVSDMHIITQWASLTLVVAAFLKTYRCGVLFRYLCANGEAGVETRLARCIHRTRVDSVPLLSSFQIPLKISGYSTYAPDSRSPYEVDSVEWQTSSHSSPFATLLCEDQSTSPPSCLNQDVSS